MFEQDHNRDIIIQFPDNSPYNLFEENETKFNGNQARRFSFRETVTSSHSPHLWYSTEEVTKALELFLIAGDKLEGSLTYR